MYSTKIEAKSDSRDSTNLEILNFFHNKISKTNLNKATKLYKFIDQSDLYFNNIEESSRSIMNIPFLLRQESLNSKFLDQSVKSDLFALKGHRSVGGMRASIYNAMPEEGIDRLIEFMKAFEKDNL